MFVAFAGPCRCRRQRPNPRPSTFRTTSRSSQRAQSPASAGLFFCSRPAGNRLAPRFPAPSAAASGGPPLATPHPRCARLKRLINGISIHFNTYSVNQKRTVRASLPLPRHRPSTCKAHLLEIPMHPRQAMRVKAARNFQKLFPPRLRATAKPLGTCRPFLLDPRWRGGARMASQATAHGGGRKSGAHPPSEPLG